ncbi:hypothetical protein PAMC26510_08550 [Caballeronia sordidicola]|uniref:Uncharacterized protein n=1 Tax=Caballeronia sordidicola TaxID=196367 RepID=A0A242N202_CABSO|nr:hypothetical protein PAMC26510_08550 [Caballeronia sordidicola]
MISTDTVGHRQAVRIEARVSAPKWRRMRSASNVNNRLYDLGRNEP